MITSKNYYSTIAEVDLSILDSALQKGADFVNEVTRNGKDWTYYETEPEIKRVIDLYFLKLGNHLNSDEQITSGGNTDASTVSSRKVQNSSLRTSVKPSRNPSRKQPLRVVKRSGQEVEKISEELKFFKRYLAMHGKEKTEQQIRSFIASLQRAIIEKRIRKTSRFADDIMELQDDSIRLLAKFKKSDIVKIVLDQERRSQLLNLIGKQELMNSVRFIKTYIGMQGKLIENKKAASFHNRLAKAINIESITEKDPYWKELEKIIISLKVFVKDNPIKGVLRIASKELSGLNGIVSGLSVSGLSGINEYDSAPRNVMMNSMDFVKLNFNKIGFTGKWLDLIGNPSRGFIALVLAPAKFGKSVMCVDWARYLAENHGMVLYVAKEEGLDDTLKEKLLHAAHPNLIVSDYLPESFEGFDFVFLDSITRLQLSPADLMKLKESNPGVSIIAISQVTKSGTARGSNAYSHDVDSIIELPSKGKAIQYGRFNQGGEMDIFQ